MRLSSDREVRRTLQVVYFVTQSRGRRSQRIIMSDEDLSSQNIAHLRSSDVSTSLRAYIRQGWQRRHFALAMPADQFRSRNQNTLLGNFWNLLNPLLTAGVYFLIFGVVLSASRGVDNYVFWLVIGLFGFRLTNSTVLQGAKAVTGRQGLVRSIRFPRILLPVASTISSLINFSFEVLILLAFAFGTGEGVSWRILLLPAVVFLHTLFNFGCALIAARLNDGFRDFERLLPFVFQILRYFSAVMIPLARFEGRGPGVVYEILSLNPLVWFLAMYRWVFLGTADGMQINHVLGLVASTLMVVLIGAKFFAAAEHRYGRP